MKDRGVVITILCCLVVMLTVLNLGQFIMIRAIVKNHQVQLQQINQQITQRDRLVQQFIGRLQLSKTIKEVQEVLREIK